MQARKCDRCGSYYDEGSVVKLNDKPVDAAVLVRRDFTHQGICYDLCHDCLQELIGWLSGKEEDHGND